MRRIAAPSFNICAFFEKNNNRVSFEMFFISKRLNTRQRWRKKKRKLNLKKKVFFIIKIHFRSEWMTKWRRMNKNESFVKIHKWRKNSSMRKKFTDEESYINKIKEKIKRKIIFMCRWSAIVALSKRIIELRKSNFKKEKQL